MNASPAPGASHAVGAHHLASASSPTTTPPAVAARGLTKTYGRGDTAVHALRAEGARVITADIDDGGLATLRTSLDPDHVVRADVANPDDVSVDMITGRRGRMVEVHVHPEDLGKVIGRGGSTATALRTLVTGIGGRGVRLDIVDTDR